MSDQDRFNSLKSDLENALLTLGFANWEAVRQATGQLLGAIVATKRNHLEGDHESTDELSSIMDLEKRIRQNKNDVHNSAREDARFPTTLRQASAFAAYYTTPDTVLDTNGNMERYEGSAEEGEEILAETLKLGIKLKEISLITLKDYEKLREEYKDLMTRLAAEMEPQAQGQAATRVPECLEGIVENAESM
jgi:hypothetical protein